MQSRDKNAAKNILLKNWFGLPSRPNNDYYSFFYFGRKYVIVAPEVCNLKVLLKAI
jgi:hypothetical protein